MWQRVLLFWLFCSPLAAQESAIALFDSAIVETGEAFSLHIKTNAPPDTIDLSSWANLLPESQVIKRSGWYSTPTGWQSDLTFIAFDSANLILPPILVLLKNGQIARSDSNHLTILATPVPSTDLNDMADIKDIHREAILWTDYLWIGWLVGGLLVLGLVLYWLFFRKKNKNQTGPIVRAVHRETALKKLEQLEKQQLWQKGEIKPYYATLSFIIREFAGHHLKIKALESSSDEILSEMDRLLVPPDLKNTLATLLHNTDLVKFAKGMPELEYHPQAMADARHFVQAFGAANA